MYTERIEGQEEGRQEVPDLERGQEVAEPAAESNGSLESRVQALARTAGQKARGRVNQAPAEKHSRTISVTLTEGQAGKLTDMAEKIGMSRTDLARLFILDRLPTDMP